VGSISNLNELFLSFARNHPDTSAVPTAMMRLKLGICMVWEEWLVFLEFSF
jgi:hypothetical protein